MKKLLLLFNKQALLLGLFLISSLSWGQATAPSLFDFTSGNSFTFTSLTGSTLPTNIAVGTIGSTGTGIFITDLTANAANGTGANQWNAEGNNGISFLGGSNNRRGTFLFRGNTTGRNSIVVSWTARTILNQANNNYIALQWRSGATGDWNNVTGVTSSGNYPFVGGATTTVTTNSVTLPSSAENLADLRIRWIYYEDSTGGARDRLAIDDITVSTSAISTTTPNLSITGTLAHGSVCINTAANTINYTITNNGTAAEGITVVSSNPEFVVSGLSSTTIAASGGTATYNVTFTPSSVGAKTATITVSSTTSGSNSPTNNLTGSGVNTTSTITSPTSAAVTATSATLGGNITVAGCSAISERGIYYSTTNNFPDGSGTKVSELGSFGTGIFTVNATSLSSGTQYYYKAFATSGVGTVYTTQGSFSTPTLPVSVPYSQDFEGAINEWTLDSAGTNKWAIGSATNNGGSNALYISNNNGVGNLYTTTSAQNGTNASLRADLTGLTNATLIFDWKSSGEFFQGEALDYGEVYINTGGADILISGAKEFYGTTIFALKTIDLSAYVGQIVTLKFRWVNDSSAGSQPPFGVDNVSIFPYGLPSFSTTAITDLTYNSATSGGIITNDGGAAITARGIVYDTAPSPTLSSTVVNSGSGTGTYVSTLAGLLSNTTYYVRAFVTNANGTSYANQVIFTTPSITAPVISPESAVLSNGFTANWQPIAGATSYELDVSLHPNFEVGGGLVTLSEGFTTYTTQSSFNSFSFSGTSSYDSTGSSGTTGPRSVQFNDQGDNALSPLLPGTATELKFWLRNNGWGSATGNNLLVEGFNGTSWVTIQTIPSSIVATTAGPSGGSQFVYNALSTPALPANITRFRFTIAKTTGNVAFDDFVATYNTSTPSFVTGFNGLNVGNVTSYNVSGLDPETTYYYRVRAIRDTDKSVNSSPETVITGSSATTWTITNPATEPAWTNGAPTAAIDAVIDADYDEMDAITAKNLTVNATAVLNVKPTQSLSIAGNLTNNGSIIFKSDATGTARFAPYTGAAIAGTGTSTVERYIPANRAWRILTAPLTGVSDNTITDNWQGTNGEGVLLFSPTATAQNGYVSGGTSPNIRKYTTSWQNIADLTTEPIFGATAMDTKPFLVFVTGPSNSTNIVTGADATTLRPKGQLITGTVNHTGLATGVYHALANPYASAIDPVSLITNNTGQKLWLINPSLGNFGAYVTFDGQNWSVPVDAQDAFIQSGQGFFVRSATATSFQINESDKVSGSSNNWFAKNAAGSTTTEADKIRVLLYKQIENNWKLADGALSVNYADGSNEVNAMDSNKISNFNESVMFRNNTTSLSIEHRALPVATEIQPIRLTGTTALPYQLRVRTENYSNSTLLPVLEDTVAGTFTTIPTDGSEVVIPFTGVAATTTNPDNRFRIVYQVNLNNVEQSPLVASVFPNPVTNNKLNIHLGSNNQMANYTVTNLLGQFIQKGTLANTQNVITLSSVSQGFYLLNITQDGKSFTTKIYVQ
jgi:hypothetical protein